jgi:hypothetical protein
MAMNGGGKVSLIVAGLAVASCASSPNGVEIRPIADPVSKLRPGADRLADAKGQLAIGNVGLALEGFRSVARLYPDNAEAYVGMAACYESIRRFDLAQSKYEAALALDPHNPALLTRLAAALDQQGKAQAAAEVRSEVAELAAASRALDEAQAEPEPAVASLAPAQTVTVVLPKPRVVPQDPELAAATGIAEPTSRLTAAQLAAASNVVMVAGSAANLDASPLRAVAPSIVQPAQAAKPVASVQLASGSTPNLAAELLRRMNAAPLRDSAPFIVRPAVPIRPAAVATPQRPVPLSPPTSGPRLERLSLGEVALLTTTAPVWRAQVVAATPQKLTVRWVSLNTAYARPNIRLLNAARTQGLAARNREYLLDRGWRKIEIADASDVRDRSLVLYPAARAAVGRSLAAQFGFRAQATTTSDVFVVFLGRDAAALKAASAKG